MFLKYCLWGILALVGGYLMALLVGAFLVNPHKIYQNHDPVYRGLLNSATWLGLKLTGVRVHVSGTEKLPKNQKLLFVGNHISNYDPIVTWYALRPWNISYVSKPENFKIPLFGRIIRKCCFVPIDRENPRNAMTAIHQAADILAQQQISIGVYPEGTRSKTGELLPFHDGVFKIGKKAGAAIAVVSVSGTNQIARNVLRRRTDVQVDVLEVIPAEAVKNGNTHLIGTAVEQLLRNSKERREIP